MSNEVAVAETKTFLVSRDQMQKLADADAVLADLTVEGLTNGNTEAVSMFGELGLRLFQLENDLVEQGLAEEVLDRSDRDSEE